MNRPSTPLDFCRNPSTMNTYTPNTTAPTATRISTCHASPPEERYRCPEPTLPLLTLLTPQTPYHEKHPQTPQYLFFTPNDAEHIYLRKRAQALCDVFNTQHAMVPLEERSKAWHEYACRNSTPTRSSTLTQRRLVKVPGKETSQLPPSAAPFVRSPFHVDYGINIHIAPSATILRNCYIQDAPDSPVTIGEGTLVGPDVHISAVKHNVDWRRRQGTFGPSWSAAVTIGDDCYIGARAMIM